MTLWTYQANPAANLSPAAVATIFGAQCDPPRELASCWGRWTHRYVWSGMFQLKGNEQIFAIRCEWDDWTVEVFDRCDQPTPGGQERS